jgi:hypothetical protein
MQAILRGGHVGRLVLMLALSAALSMGLMGVSAGSASAAGCPSGAAAIIVNSYRLTGPPPTAVIRTVTQLRGNVNQGDAIDQVTFTVNASCTAGVDVALVAYAAPGPTWDPATASRQQVVDSQVATSQGPGQHTLSLIPVVVPAGCFQVDFVRGAIIAQFSPPGGTYSAMNRLRDFDNGDPGCTPVV